MIIKSDSINFHEATKIFNSFEAHLVLNSLSPRYVQLDSLRNSKLLPTYWYANYEDYKYLHCFHITKNKKYNIFDIESPLIRFVHSPSVFGIDQMLIDFIRELPELHELLEIVPEFIIV